MHIFTKFMQYHKSISDKSEQDYYIPVYASLGGPFCKVPAALYNISNKMREMFNLSRRVSLNELDLRKYFDYILSLACEKLKQEVTIDKDIVIFFESVDKMREKDSGFKEPDNSSGSMD